MGWACGRDGRQEADLPVFGGFIPAPRPGGDKELITDTPFPRSETCALPLPPPLTWWDPQPVPWHVTWEGGRL